MPSRPTSSSPLYLMVVAILVKSPFSHSALFGFIGADLLACRPSGRDHRNVLRRRDRGSRSVRDYAAWHDDHDVPGSPLHLRL